MYGLENPISKHDIISADSLKVRMQVEEKSFVSDNIPALESWKKLPSGIYRLVLQVTDTNGNWLSEMPILLYIVCKIKSLR